jgi:hypothetical protein
VRMAFVIPRTLCHLSCDIRSDMSRCPSDTLGTCPKYSGKGGRLCPRMSFVLLREGPAAGGRAEECLTREDTKKRYKGRL